MTVSCANPAFDDFEPLLFRCVDNVLNVGGTDSFISPLKSADDLFEVGESVSIYLNIEFLRTMAQHERQHLGDPNRHGSALHL